MGRKSSNNAREDITENWSAQLDESDLIQKMKWLETTYENHSQYTLQNSFNVTYVHIITTYTQLYTSWGCELGLCCLVSSS